MIYHSKKDTWLVMLVVCAGIVLVGTAIDRFISKGIHDPATIILLLTSSFYIAVLSLLAFPVSYEITTSDLMIRSGVTRTRIPLDSIDKVYPTRNPLSAPAWSLDRLHIVYRGKTKSTFTLISPEKKRSFLQELVQNTPGLELSNDGVLRTERPGR